MPFYKYEKTTITTTLKEYEFITSGIVVTQPVWKSLYTEEKKNDGPLPQVSENEKVAHLKSELEQKFTQPPAAFNESSLLNKMESLSMGTPATRAAIIEKLLERQ